MAENNLIKTTDLKYPITIDVSTRFEENLNKMFELLGITRKIAVSDGQTLRIYDGYNVTLEDGAVGEGELIPLSKVERKPHKDLVIKLKKYRKATDAESVQMYGANEAITNTDDALVRQLQKEIRKQFVATLKTGTTTQTAVGAGLQGAIASAWGRLEVLFEDYSTDKAVIFANPLDIAKYLGNASITTQTVAGLTFVTGFLDTVIISTTDVAEGEIWATVPENINVAYISATGSAVAKEFGLSGDATGYIGMKHFLDNTTATTQTLLMSGIEMFPERIDGIVKVAITAGV